MLVSMSGQHIINTSIRFLKSYTMFGRRDGKEEDMRGEKRKERGFYLPSILLTRGGMMQVKLWMRVYS